MSGTARRRAAAVAAAPTTAIAITTGANLRRARAIAMTMMRGRSDVVLEMTGKGQTGMVATAITIPAGLTAIATIENAIQVSETHSADTFTCRAGWSASSFATAIVSTPCGAPNRGRWRPLAHSEWSPVVIFETTMEARLILGSATCDTYANKG